MDTPRTKRKTTRILSPADWFRAREKLTRLITGYAILTVRAPGTPAVTFSSLNNLLERYERGERTLKLYSQIMRTRL